MVTEERLIRILFSRWIHDMRKKQLPDLEAREETVRDVMTMISISGKVTAGEPLTNARTGEVEKITKPLTVLGKKQIENDGIIKQR